MAIHHALFPMSHPLFMQGFALSYCILALSMASSASAQIIPDATLLVNSVVPGGCTNCDITGGTQEGGNLFHSFGEFSIPTGGSARFVHNPEVNLIFSRVTGDLRSDIDGSIETSGTADLFFLNPNGILFGPNAAINVGGSFVASSAAGITFADGTQFVTASEPTSLLTMTAPVGLQFGADPGDMVNQSKTSRDGFDALTGLQGFPGTTVALIGGEVRLINGDITAPGGHVELGSVTGNSTVQLQPSESGWSFNYSDASGFEDITLSNFSVVDLSSVQGVADGVSSSAHLQGQDIDINEESLIVGINLGAGPGGTVQVDAANLLHVHGAGKISTITEVVEDPAVKAVAGDIQIYSQNLRVAGGGAITSESRGVGNEERAGGSGNVHVRVQDLVEVIGNDSSISITAESLLENLDGQTLTIETARLLVRDGGNILSRSFAGEADVRNRRSSGDINVMASEGIQLIGVGPTNDSRPSGIFTSLKNSGFINIAGEINIQTAQLEILDGAQIESEALRTFGNGGNVTVNATEFILVSGTSGTGHSSAISSAAGRLANPSFGNTGDISVTTPLLTVESGARISTDTFSSGIGGDTTLDVGQLRVLNGGTVSAGSLVVRENIADLGRGGRLSINASELVKVSGTGTLGDSPIKSALSARAQGAGPAGDIAIATPLLTVTDGGEIIASTEKFWDGGDVTINADAIRLTSGGSINSSTAGTGDGGSIVLTLQDELTLAGNESGLFANTEPGSTGNGGSITVDPDLLQLTDGAQISVSSEGEGIGGNIDLTANILSLDNGSQIAAETASTTGGNVILTVDDWVFLNGNSRISATAGSLQGAGNGGNVTINLTDGFFIAEVGSDNDIIAQAFEGTGGNIAISARGIYGLAERPAIAGNGTNDIDASSEFGQSGTITFNDPIVDPSEADVELPTEILNAAELVDRRCQADVGQGQSSLILTGRGGLPPDPAQIVRSDEGAMTELGFDEVSSEVALPSHNRLTKEVDAASSEPLVQVIEAHTWERNEAGHAVLIASQNSLYRALSVHPCK